MPDFTPSISPLSLVCEHPGAAAGITLYLKRDELLHPRIQGNKWRKLEPVLAELQAGGYAGLLTFGGPFSNHLHAVAAAGKAYGFRTAAVLRGLSADLSNPTLAFARACGMDIWPVAKKDYDAGSASAAVQAIEARYPQFLRLPEGGNTLAAAQHCRRVSEEILQQAVWQAGRPLFVAVPAGSGCTAAGVIAGLGAAGQALVFPAAPYGVQEETLLETLRHLVAAPLPAFRLFPEYGQEGFARLRPERLDFAVDFYLRTGILLDPIYTLKMMAGLFDLLQNGFFPAESVVVAVHTGGLQGWAGFRQRYGRRT